MVFVLSDALGLSGVILFDDAAAGVLSAATFLFWHGVLLVGAFLLVPKIDFGAGGVGGPGCLTGSYGGGIADGRL